MKKIACFFSISILNFFTLFSQDISSIYGEIDVQKYVFQIALNDSTNVIEVEANITILFKKPLQSFSLDLINKDSLNNGMKITQILEGGKDVHFDHSNNKILIYSNVQKSETIKNFIIKYHGIPKDGLIISKNKFGDRTFFGDNWPNRARNWLACVDHPLDKSQVEFHVTAPSHYQVIANGTKIEETNLVNNRTLYKWKTEVQIPTKVMVIGVAGFAVQQIGETHNIPVSSWVYPQNKNEGFYDYAMAKEILNYFIDHIDSYPFSKLASVQSKTRFGGMENAGNIFYSEKSVTGKRRHESLIAHEIAHQWFGNSITETNWKHLWLSEGFATYSTNLYLEDKYGENTFRKRMEQQRKKIIKFSKDHHTAVIDTVTTKLMKLLNANSYEKGSWVLHMLRKKIGDELFWKGLKIYYKTYKFKNASTEDLINVFENVSKQSLEDFFTQWLKWVGHPILKSSFVKTDKSILIKIEQVQKDFPIFNFPLEVELVYSDGNSELATIQISKQEEIFTLSVKKEVKEILIDPDVWLLYESN